MTYKTYMTNKESAANCLVCLIHQTNYLLDQQMKVLEKDLVKNGDYKERYKKVKKEEAFGVNGDYKNFLKNFGMKRWKNGQVVKEDKEE